MTRKTASRPPAAFTPVPVRPRADGWTAGRQTGFIEALAASGDVEAAARAVGMTRQFHPQERVARGVDAEVDTERGA